MQACFYFARVLSLSIFSLGSQHYDFHFITSCASPLISFYYFLILHKQQPRVRFCFFSLYWLINIKIKISMVVVVVIAASSNKYTSAKHSLSSRFFLSALVFRELTFKGTYHHRFLHSQWVHYIFFTLFLAILIEIFFFLVSYCCVLNKHLHIHTRLLLLLRVL